LDLNELDVEVKRLIAKVDPNLNGVDGGICKEKFLEHFSVEEFDHFDKDCDGVLSYKELRARALILHCQAQDAQIVNHRDSQVRSHCDNHAGTEAERVYLSVLDSEEPQVTHANEQIMKTANMLILFQQSTMKKSMACLRDFESSIAQTKIDSTFVEILNHEEMKQFFPPVVKQLRKASNILSRHLKQVMKDTEEAPLARLSSLLIEATALDDEGGGKGRVYAEYLKSASDMQATATKYLNMPGFAALTH